MDKLTFQDRGFVAGDESSSVKPVTNLLRWAISVVSVRTIMLGSVGLVLGGCAAGTVVHDYSAFSTSYARDMNWQMLMNLARLDQGQPPYFVAIGEFKMNRTHTVGVALDRTHSAATTDVLTATPPTKTIVDTVTRLWKPNVSTQVVPQMSFIPMNSEETAKQLLQSVPNELFLTLYQQGWRIDHLLRVLVERVEFENGTYYNNGVVGEDTGSYINFLCFAEIMRGLQEKRQLEIKNISSALQALGSPVSTPPTAKDINDAAAQGRVWQSRASPTDNTTVWELGSVRTSAQLKVNSNGQTALVSLLAAGYAALPDTYSISSAPVVSEKEKKGATFVMRSFRSILEALAAEERDWPSYKLKDDASIKAKAPRQQRTILRFHDPDVTPGAKPASEQVQISYGGRSYRVVDDGGKDPQWNRDVFRLVVQISSQVSVDISKFQRTVLQVSP